VSVVSQATDDGKALVRISEVSDHITVAKLFIISVWHL